MRLRLLVTSAIGGVNRALLAVSVVLAAAGNLHAGLTIVADDPSVRVVQGAASTANVPLRLTNASTAEVNPMVFFATIEIVKDVSAIGDVQINSVGTPTDYLFRDMTTAGIQRLWFEPGTPSLPVRAGTWFDAAENAPGGVPIASGGSIGLADLELILSPNAQGTFFVVLAAFGDDFSSASSWSDGGNPGIPLSFENGQAGSAITQRTLARIDVVAVPEPATFTPLLLGVAALARRRR